MKQYKKYIIKQEVYYIERDDGTRMVDQEEIKREFESKLDQQVNKIDTYKCGICKKIKPWINFDNESSEAYIDEDYKHCFCDTCGEKIDIKNSKT